MADYGMPPLEVLRSATLTGAELLGKADELGRVAPGYLADIIAVAPPRVARFTTSRRPPSPGELTDNLSWGLLCLLALLRL